LQVSAASAGSSAEIPPLKGASAVESKSKPETTSTQKEKEESDFSTAQTLMIFSSTQDDVTWAVERVVHHYRVEVCKRNGTREVLQSSPAEAAERDLNSRRATGIATLFPSQIRPDAKPNLEEKRRFPANRST
jgi:hypothetical protein